MGKRNNRRILTVVVIAMTLFAFEMALESLMEKVRYGGVGKINSIVDKSTDYPIMVWGASSAEVNISPLEIENEIGMSCFNMGLDGTNIDQYHGLLEYYLKYSKNCKKLVLAVDMQGGLEKRTQVYKLFEWLHHLDQPEIFNAVYGIDKGLALKSKYFPFYNLVLYDKHGAPFIFKSFQTIAKGENTAYSFPENGFIPKEKSMALDMKWDVEKAISISDSTLVHFKKIIAIAESKNIKTYIVITPCYTKGFTSLLNRYQFIEHLNSLKSKNAIVLNYSEHEISKDQQNFYDNTHLNKKGASIFSKILAQDLIKN